MAEVNTSSVAKRRYRSPLRESQAAATRARILDAALDEFGARGYPGTSIAAIARAASVSAETVYATFGSKRGIVDGLLAQVDAEGRPQALAVTGSPGSTPRAEIEVLAAVSTDFWATHGDLVRFLRQGIGDPEIGQEWRRRQELRRKLLRGVVERWPSGAIRSELDADSAADVAWTLTSHEQFELLVGIRGWPVARYVAWLTRMLRRELLARP